MPTPGCIAPLRLQCVVGLHGNALCRVSGDSGDFFAEAMTRLFRCFAFVLEFATNLLRVVGDLRAQGQQQLGDLGVGIDRLAQFCVGGREVVTGWHAHPWNIPSSSPSTAHHCGHLLPVWLGGCLLFGAQLLAPLGQPDAFFGLVELPADLVERL